MSAPRRHNRTRRSPKRLGAAAVEFALTAPILFMLLFAALEFGRVNMIRETVSNAAYEAARTCIVPGATNAEGVDAADRIIRSIGVRDAKIQIQPSTITDTTPSVTATVTVPYNTNLWMPPFYFADGSASTTCTLIRDWAVSTRSSE